jgi:hypothetical protein
MFTLLLHLLLLLLPPISALLLLRLHPLLLLLYLADAIAVVGVATSGPNVPTRVAVGGVEENIKKIYVCERKEVYLVCIYRKWREKKTKHLKWMV